jgi:cell division transport system permease protein
MLWVNIKRVVRAGFVNFWRNGFISLTSILVMSVTLFVIGSVVFNSALLNASLQELRNKADINVYFVTSAPEEDILALKKTLESLPEVASVEYVSREQALKDFEARHADDELIVQGLTELGENPLPAALNIKAKEPSQYGSVAKFLESENALSRDGKALIENSNYNRNKVIIDKLTTIINTSEQSNLIRTVILVFLSIVVVFNTIRLVIYTAREEISVMRLVGASNRYIRGPFVVSGIIYGVLAGIVTLAVFYPLTYKFGPLFYPFPMFLGEKINNLSLFDYYVSNFGELFVIVIGGGIVLGAISSYLAVKKYLRV